MKKPFLLLFVALLLATPSGWTQTRNYFNGFESTVAAGDWESTARRASGYNGIPASTGSYYGETGVGDFTKFGGYNNVFPTNGYRTSIDIYLNVSGGYANDLRFDYSSAINDIVNNHRRDFVFTGGFYNDATGPGANTNRFIFSTCNNTPGDPRDINRSPIAINTNGWYTFEHYFHNIGTGVLAVDMNIYNSAHVLMGTWTLSEPTDKIGITVGGNRYGWMVTNQFGTLAIDNCSLTLDPMPTVLTTIAAPSSLVCGTFDVPVTVRDFTNVGSFSLIFNYETAKLTYQGITLNPAISVTSIKASILNNLGILKLGYFGTAKTLADDAVLFTMHFNLFPSSTGTTNLTWSNEPNTGNCEYTGPDGDVVYSSTFIDQTLTIPARSVVNTNTHLQYCTIQAAIDATATLDGHTITVAAGNYAENVTVSKSLTILGPNADVDPTTASPSRVAEAIVMPAVNDAVNGRVFDVIADNVTINGFTVDGDNPGINGGISINGADINAEFGIGSGSWTSSNGGKNGMVVKYNIVKNFKDGCIYGNGSGTPVSGGLFTYNKVDNSSGWGIVMETNCYTDITHNKITRVNNGIQYDNYWKAKSSGGSVIEFNDITYSKRGILQNLFYESGSLFEIKNNTLTASTSPVVANAGLMYWSIAAGITATASNNTINANEQGIRIWNCQGIVTVDANTLNGGQYGVKVTTNDDYGPGSVSNTAIIWNTINNPSLASLYLEDTDAGVNSISVTATNNFFTGGADGVKLSGAELTATVNSNSITGQSSKGVNATAYTGTNLLDFNCNWWGVTSASAVALKVAASNPPINYASWLTSGTDSNLPTAGFQPSSGSCNGTPVVISSAIADNITCGEVAGSITVTFSGGAAPYSIIWPGGTLTSTITSPYTITGLPAGICNFTIADFNGSTAVSSAEVLYLPVTNTSSSTFYPTIQAAIDHAADGNIITVCAGTYAENVVVSKSLTINGAQAGVDPRSTGIVARAGGESIVFPPSVNTSESGIDLFTIAANNVTVDGFTFNGNNPLLSGGVNINGTNIHAARAFSNQRPKTAVNNLKVKNNIIMNLYRQGIYLWTSSFTAQQNNLVEKNVFDNIHRLTADGTATGVYMENEATADVKNNKMTRIGRGIMTATLGSFVNVPFEFSNNEITSYITGIWVNNHHSAAPLCKVINNTINSEASSTTNDGMRITSMFVTDELEVSKNVISAKRYGYRIWNLSSNTVKVTGGSVTGATQGIYASNYYPGFGDERSFSFIVDAVSIQNSINQAICIEDDALNPNGATVSAEIKNVTITGSATGILVSGADAGANIHNNSIAASVMGISVAGTSTNSTVGLSIVNNAITFSSQLAGLNPTVGVALSKVIGSVAAVINSNTISGSYYGYMVYNLNTTPKTTITGGTISGVMQGVSAFNVDLSGSGIYAASTIGVSDITMSGFEGNHVELPNTNFHAGVYVFTGGAVDAAGIIASVDKVNVNGTGKIQGDCAGLYFTDWSTNAVKMQDITVTECTLINNLNRGIFVSGKNATVNIGTSTLTGNGSDPYGTGGNDGYGIIVRKGAFANVHNCFITNPASVANGYQVSALFTDPANDGSATINATENSLSQGGNATSWLANNTPGATINASCNWWGTASTTGIAATINGTVTYPTLLISGLDANVAAAGFQPTGSCVTKEVVINCVADVTLSSCSTQEAVDAAYATFITSATASGCTGVLTNNAPTTAPSICGGSVLVIWTYNSLCETKTCSATFTVTPAPAVSLTCASDLTVASCQTQDAVDAAYTAWLATASLSGGCNAKLTNNSSGAPLACGGSKTVIWTVNSNCQAPVTCSKAFTVTSVPAIVLICPVAVNEASCQTQAAIDAKFTSWLRTIVASGGCSGELTNNNTGAPSASGGSTTVTYTYASSCEPLSTTCSATFTVASPKKISGYLKYNNLAETSLNKATVTLSGDKNAITTTDINGYYEFTGLCNGTYTIAVTDDRAVGYINLTDAAQVNKWGVSGGDIEYVKFLSGDVNVDHFVNNDDAQRIQQYFVNGNPFEGSPWTYWKQGVKISRNLGPITDNFDVIVSGADMTCNLYGMCKGDFNGSFTPATKSAKWTLELNNNSMVNAGANQEFELPLRAASAMQVGAVSMILNIPSGLVNVQDVLVNGSLVAAAWAVKGDELRIGWYSSTPVNVTENGNLITLKLKTTNAFTVGQSMEFALELDPLNELADGNYDVINDANLLVAQVGNGVTGILNPSDNNGLSLSNYPNPFKNSTTVSYALPVQGKVTIQVYNSLGQLVKYLLDSNQNVGNHSIRMDGNNLMPGIYIAKLRLINQNVDLTGTVKLSVLK